MKRLLCLFLLIVLTGCSTLNVNYPEMPDYVFVGPDSPHFANLKGEEVRWGELEGYYFKKSSYSEKTNEYLEWVVIESHPRTDRRPVPDALLRIYLNEEIPYINSWWPFYDLLEEETSLSWLDAVKTREDLDGVYMIEKASLREGMYLDSKFLTVSQEEPGGAAPNDVTLTAVRILPLKGRYFSISYEKVPTESEHLLSINAALDSFTQFFMAAN